MRNYYQTIDRLLDIRPYSTQLYDTAYINYLSSEMSPTNDIFLLFKIIKMCAVAGRGNLGATCAQRYHSSGAAGLKNGLTRSFGFDLPWCVEIDQHIPSVFDDRIKILLVKYEHVVI